MDVASSRSSAVAAQAVAAPTGSARQEFQIALLKKALDAQRQSAQALLNLSEGKGTRLDIRA